MSSHSITWNTRRRSAVTQLATNSMPSGISRPSDANFSYTGRAPERNRSITMNCTQASLAGGRAASHVATCRRSSANAWSAAASGSGTTCSHSQNTSSIARPRPISTYVSGER